jgi:hypothetical protein
LGELTELIKIRVITNPDNTKNRDTPEFPKDVTLKNIGFPLIIAESK